MLPPELSFELPDERIAREPATPRDASRLLRVSRRTGSFSHERVADLPSRLAAGDCLVLNDTRVLPARLRSEISGKPLELLLLRSLPSAPLTWECLARPARRIGAGATVAFPGGVTAALSRTESPEGICLARFDGLSSRHFFAWLETAGEMPIPPYLKREPTAADRARYQTVFAREAGSVAAPTAGLHFTPELLGRIEQKGVRIARVTLHVGYGTFSPLRPEHLAEGRLHPERFEVPEPTLAAIDRTKREGGRVVAVGTTTVRALEACALGDSGETRLLIRPGFAFQRVDALLTNFHLPGSSLLLLVAAFLGTELTRKAYDEALRENYRFYSYGDAMLIE